MTRTIVGHPGWSVLSDLAAPALLLSSAPAALCPPLLTGDHTGTGQLLSCCPLNWPLKSRETGDFSLDLIEQLQSLSCIVVVHFTRQEIQRFLSRNEEWASFRFHRVITVKTPKQCAGRNFLWGQINAADSQKADGGLPRWGLRPWPSVCRLGVWKRLGFSLSFYIIQFLFGKEYVKHRRALTYREKLRMVALCLDSSRICVILKVNI